MAARQTHAHGLTGPTAGVNLQPGLQLGLTFSWGQPSAGVNLQLGSTFSQATGLAIAGRIVSVITKHKALS